LLNDDAIKQICLFCQNLVEIDLTGIIIQTPCILQSLFESLPKLVKIAFRDLKADDRFFFDFFKDIAQRIEYVDFCGCTSIRGRFFTLFGSELQEVLLDGCHNIDDEVIEDLCIRSSDLKTISIGGCVNITNESLSLISRNLLDLRSLSLGGHPHSYTADGLMNIGRMGNIQALSFDFNPSLTDQHIVMITNRMFKLQRLSLGFAGSDMNITPASLMKLEQLKELSDLNISGLSSVNDEVLMRICSCCHEIEKLVMHSCVYLGDSGVAAIVHLEKINYIDLSGCILVTSDPIQLLCNKFNINETVVTRTHNISLLVGGTACKPHQIRLRNSRIQLDPTEDNVESRNEIYLTSFRDSNSGCDIEYSLDDDLNLFSAHRSFIADALSSKDESLPIELDERVAQDWAQNEALNLPNSL